MRELRKGLISAGGLNHPANVTLGCPKRKEDLSLATRAVSAIKMVLDADVVGYRAVVFHEAGVRRGTCSRGASVEKLLHDVEVRMAGVSGQVTKTDRIIRNRHKRPGAIEVRFVSQKPLYWVVRTSQETQHVVE